MEIQDASKQKMAAPMIKETHRPMPKMTFHNVLKTLACLGLAAISAISSAETLGPFAIVESKPISEPWLNAGFYTYHFQKYKGLNNNNFGLGGEYRYSTTTSITAGSFDNSNRQTSHYVGWYWQPLAWGPVRLGAVAGGFDGYPKVKSGGWFATVIPVASLEYKSVGANMIFTPKYKNMLYEALSIQLKIKVY